MSAFSPRFAAGPPGAGRAPSPAPGRARRAATHAVDELDDPLFVGLLSALSLAAGAFWVWVEITPTPEPPLPLGEEVARLVRDLPPVVLRMPEPEVAAEVAVRPAVPSPSARPRREDPAPAGARSARESTLLERLDGFGPGADAFVELVGPDDPDALERALAGVHADPVAARGGEAFRRGAGRDEAWVAIGRTGVDGGVATSSLVVAPVRRTVETEPPVTDAADAGDAAVIARIVRTHRGRIDTCLEQALKGDPTVSGRVSAGWTIRAGRVADVHLVANTTGSDALGACVARAVRTFAFPAGMDAEVAELPWVVSGQ